jgi:hypothetical protein
MEATISTGIIRNFTHPNRVMLFFSMFVPLEKSFSVDNALKLEEDSPDHHDIQEKTPAHREIYRSKSQKKSTRSETNSKKHFIVDIATFTLIVQLLFMYFCAFFHKTGKEWTTTGTSSWLALQLDFFRRPFGDFLLLFPNVCRFFTFAVLYWQSMLFFSLLN